MPTDIQNVVDRARANHHDLSEDVAEQLVRRKSVYVQLAADGAAGTTVAETQVWVCPTQFANGVKVKGIRVVPQANVTADNTNYATWTFKAKTAAGATVGTNICAPTTKITGSGNLTAFVAYAPTLTTTEADKVVPVSGCITFEQAKAAGGVQLPVLTLEIVFDAL